MSEWTTEDVRKAWHDATCPEGDECRDREVHQLSFESMSVVLELFLDYLPDKGVAHDAQVRAEALRDAQFEMADLLDHSGDTRWHKRLTKIIDRARARAERGEA